MGAAILDRKSWGPPSLTGSDVKSAKVAPILLSVGPPSARQRNIIQIVSGHHRLTSKTQFKYCQAIIGPPAKHHSNIVRLSSARQRNIIQIVSGHHWPASETPFKQCQATIGPPAKLHSNSARPPSARQQNVIQMAFRWRDYGGPHLYANCGLFKNKISRENINK